jgi:hypothetical protein
MFRSPAPQIALNESFTEYKMLGPVIMSLYSSHCSEQLHTDRAATNGSNSYLRFS